MRKVGVLSILGVLFIVVISATNTIITLFRNYFFSTDPYESILYGLGTLLVIAVASMVIIFLFKFFMKQAEALSHREIKEMMADMKKKETSE